MHLLTPGLISHLSTKHHATANYVPSRMAWKPYQTQLSSNSFVCASAQQLNTASTPQTRAQLEQRVKFARYEERDSIIGYALDASCPLCDYAESLSDTPRSPSVGKVDPSSSSGMGIDDKELSWKLDLDDFAKAGETVTAAEWNERFSHIPSNFVDEYMLTAASPGIVIVADSPAPYYASRASKFPRSRQGVIVIPNSINSATSLPNGRIIAISTNGHEARCRYVDLRYPGRKRLLLEVYDEVEDIEEEDPREDDEEPHAPLNVMSPILEPVIASTSSTSLTGLTLDVRSASTPPNMPSTSSFSFAEDPLTNQHVPTFDHRRAASPLSRPDTPRFMSRARCDILLDSDVSSSMKAIASLATSGVITKEEAREMLMDLGVL
ncbi:P9 [Sclerotinia sclerotiorum mycoreovirus 4]|uniref:P9 n=1 Tax=Sclerotinia sclerotiorum mycoreovirus 4 TaxID=1840528 RepID=UPI0007C18660|nr:P9 [Sclerotinia sclerotiorum mycoreovirus 4]ANC52167.1 P9 [Sclerotinia sclerotiorum mycoreovirus 4]